VSEVPSVHPFWRALVGAGFGFGIGLAGYIFGFGAAIVLLILVILGAIVGVLAISGD
jgi:hypothetical protein